MSDGSQIEWTDATWNPVTGCTKVSPGCKNCYAERFAERFRGVPGHPFEQGFDIRLWPDRLEEPLHWRRPRRVFVNSMSDLFHPEVPDEFIEGCFNVMNEANWHQFQVLTKRPERALEIANQLEWGPNIWMGVSVESQLYTKRIATLKQIPAKVRFLSCEPLLGPLKLNLRGIHWVIVGGESGPGSRPMLEEWVKDIRRQCRVSRVPFFFKQWGGVVKSRTGRSLDGRTYDDMPRQLLAAA
ncbi:MAG: phage Gp37/Gp68 family protein [Euryarchaeota archaeon]|nr:phage Gp37/Gp68 family protein [Euryarchaeota archaeon]